MENEIRPIFRDIRRYYCQFCGTCRSKKALISKHILADHPEEMEKTKEVSSGESEGQKGNNTCEECGLSFKKPAHLKQHMLSHSLERPFVCPVDDCNASYRRKDHLNRHLIQHQGKLFKCPVDGCNTEFSIHGNISRHVKDFHEGKPKPVPGSVPEEPKKHICDKAGCGKEFKYASRLQKHEESHVESCEAFCADPDCLKTFANRECLEEHMRTFHQYINCEVCGSKHLRKNYKRHLRSHDDDDSSIEVFSCSFDGCKLSFTTSSNLRQHVKAVHLNLRPFACSVPGCGMSFAFKHVRDNHENSFRHVYVEGDIEEFDEEWRSRPHGGRKRKSVTVESLMRKRITPPNECDSVLNHSAEYLSWLLSADD